MEDVSLLTDEFQLGDHPHSPRSSMHSSRSKEIQNLMAQSPVFTQFLLTCCTLQLHLYPQDCVCVSEC